MARFPIGGELPSDPAGFALHFHFVLVVWELVEIVVVFSPLMGYVLLEVKGVLQRVISMSFSFRVAGSWRQWSDSQDDQVVSVTGWKSFTGVTVWR